MVKAVKVTQAAAAADSDSAADSAAEDSEADLEADLATPQPLMTAEEALAAAEEEGLTLHLSSANKSGFFGMDFGKDHSIARKYRARCGSTALGCFRTPEGAALCRARALARRLAAASEASQVVATVAAPRRAAAPAAQRLTGKKRARRLAPRSSDGEEKTSEAEPQMMAVVGFAGSSSAAGTSIEAHVEGPSAVAPEDEVEVRLRKINRLVEKGLLSVSEASTLRLELVRKMCINVLRGEGEGMVSVRRCWRCGRSTNVEKRFMLNVCTWQIGNHCAPRLWSCRQAESAQSQSAQSAQSA